jgi:hypothetical protein
LLKAGRPDLVIVDVPAPKWDAAAAVLRHVAAQLFDGVMLTPGDIVSVGAERLRVSTYAPAPANDLHLNNAGLVLTAH